MPTSPSAYTTAAETARRLGLTVRALRVYERHGLVRPGRTAAGWRVYGPEEFQRLHQVLALKQLGLKLSQVAAVLKGGAVDLDGVLALQQADLVERLRQIERALNLVRRLRARLSEGDALSTDDIVNLTKETVMSVKEPSPEFLALVGKHSDPALVKKLHPNGWTKADQERVGAKWSELISEAEMLKNGDPGSPEALDLARRWRDLVGEFTRGNPELGASTSAIYEEGFSKPEMTSHMPFSPEIWRFMQDAGQRLRTTEGS